MKKVDLINQIYTKKSFLCIGLDVDLDKIPNHLLDFEDPIFEFNKRIIDATHHLAVAYKPNLAFYEVYGIKGWMALEKTMEYLHTNYPNIFTIADAKRGDIGNTADRYAKAFFEKLRFNALTVSPYMGRDAIEPFLAYEDKFVVLLALTSNSGASDFQLIENKENIQLFEQVLHQSLAYKNAQQLMFVVGATKTAYIKKVRSIVPNHFLLVPGIGTQGGDFEEVCKCGLNHEIGLLINSSREIIYAGNEIDFDQKARYKAYEYQQKMAKLIENI